MLPANGHWAAPRCWNFGDPMRRPSIYLAGPDVFFPDAIEIGQAKKQVCDAAGAIGLFPLDNELTSAADEGRDVARAIYEGNERMMRDADCAIANLTPFRGPNVDDGTAFEVRAMIGQNKPVFGYANVTGSLRERTAVYYRRALEVDPATGRLHGPDGHFVEDFGLPVNLMIACGIENSGGRVFLHNADAGRVDSDLIAFGRCVEAAVAFFN